MIFDDFECCEWASKVTQTYEVDYFLECVLRSFFWIYFWSDLGRFWGRFGSIFGVIFEHELDMLPDLVWGVEKTACHTSGPRTSSRDRVAGRGRGGVNPSPGLGKLVL